MTDMIPVAQYARLEEMVPFCVEHDGVPYCLIKVGEKVNAFISICTHKDLAMFPPKTKKELLVCPHHKVAFDPATGEVIKDRGKKVDDLTPVEVQIVNGVVHLETRKKHRKLVPKSERKWVENESRKRHVETQDFASLQ
jgi:nitrite reductase/ring-hydroxylating ferredoxin subunit